MVLDPTLNGENMGLRTRGGNTLSIIIITVNICPID
jgi:hypothetical protein